MTRLDAGDTFPTLTVTPVDGDPLTLPDAFTGHYAVILFHRGSWCPHCNAQLRAFQRAREKLAELDVKVVAVSVDDEETTRATITKPTPTAG